MLMYINFNYFTIFKNTLRMIMKLRDHTLTMIILLKIPIWSLFSQNDIGVIKYQEKCDSKCFVQYTIIN